ncbi:MAG TPA: hypothetical protein VHP83_19640, partial [Aggregatilineaceae bacterium]|nr:hypothetical protein [Aggregatilineaceae bacterium]
EEITPTMDFPPVVTAEVFPTPTDIPTMEIRPTEEATAEATREVSAELPVQTPIPTEPPTPAPG